MRGAGGGTGAHMTTEGALTETCGGVTVQADRPMDATTIRTDKGLLDIAAHSIRG